MAAFKRKASEIRDIHEAQRTFLDWLNDFNAIDDEKLMFEMLEGCPDELPPDACESLGLDVRSSFGDAVEAVDWFRPDESGAELDEQCRR